MQPSRRRGQNAEVTVTVFSQTETAITIDGPAGGLEARLRGGAPDGPLAGHKLVAIVCHPHPQHGGSMDNKVVTTLVRTCVGLGVAAVRFNFRGVGQSGGEYDRAVGEVDDLMAVVHWLATEAPGHRYLLAGFSFGSAVAAAASYRLNEAMAQLTLVAPPLERYDYDRGGRFPCPVCVVQGERDEVVVSEGVLDWYERTLTGAKTLLRYPEAGHYFHGHLSVLKRDLTEALLEQLETGA